MSAKVVYDLSRDYGIKPCPSCGKKPSIRESGKNPVFYEILHFCGNGREDYIEARIRMQETPMAAVEKWNKQVCKDIEMVKEEDSGQSYVDVVNGYMATKTNNS